MDVVVAAVVADVVLVGVAVGLASLAATSEVDAFGLALALAEALADGVGAVADVAVLSAWPTGSPSRWPTPWPRRGGRHAVYACSSSTGRKASLAVVLIRLTTFVAALPGTVTVIWSLPCVWTWAPELPVPFTRVFQDRDGLLHPAADGARRSGSPPAAPPRCRLTGRARGRP